MLYFKDIILNLFSEVYCMGRKRVDPKEKRIGLKLSVKRKYVDELKERNINISQLFEQFVEEYLKR